VFVTNWYHLYTQWLNTQRGCHSSKKVKTINCSLWNSHCIAITLLSLLSNKVGSTPWPDNIWDRSDQRRSFGGCNTSNSFSAFWPVQNATWARAKRRIFNVSTGPEKTFSAFWSAKKRRPGRGRESHDSRVRLALQTHFLPSGRPKCDLGEVEKAMFQGVARQCALIF
jgi:hypothetical protein